MCVSDFYKRFINASDASIYRVYFQVEVHSKNDIDEKTTCVYRGVFLSWGPSHKEETGSLQLPILLSRGLQTVTQAVHIILSQMFDCIITALPASQVDLMWLTVIILNSGDRVENRKSKQQTQRELILEYQVPGLPASELITVKLPLNSVLNLWSKYELCLPECSELSSSIFHLVYDINFDVA